MEKNDVPNFDNWIKYFAGGLATIGLVFGLTAYNSPNNREKVYQSLSVLRGEYSEEVNLGGKNYEVKVNNFTDSTRYEKLRIEIKNLEKNDKVIFVDEYDKLSLSKILGTPRFRSIDRVYINGVESSKDTTENLDDFVEGFLLPISISLQKQADEKAEKEKNALNSALRKIRD